MRLLLPLLAVFSLVLADVEVLSTNLRGWEGCTRDQRAKISVGWEGAIKGDNDFNEEAVVEFFGPPPYPDKHADNVRKILESTSTFGRGSKWYPAPYKRRVYVRCDDWEKKCPRNPGHKAYTGNYQLDKTFPRIIHKPLTDEERLKWNPIITFCPSYFRMRDFAKVVSDNKNMEITEKYNLEYYHSIIEYVVLHEIMHMDITTFPNNGNRHTYDMLFGIEGIKDSVKAYASGLRQAVLPADSFALYAISKAVQKSLGNKYLYLPRPYAGQELEDGPNGRKAWPPHPADACDNYSRLTWSEHSLLGHFIHDPNMDCMSGNNVDTCPAVIEVSKLIEDWKSSKEYIDKRTNWLKEVEGHAGKRPIVREDSSIPGDASLRYDFDTAFMPPVDAIETTFAKQKIIKACKLCDGISLDKTKQPTVQMPYEGEGAEMHTYAAWNTGDAPCVSRGGGQISQQQDLSTALRGGRQSDYQQLPYQRY